VGKIKTNLKLKLNGSKNDVKVKLKLISELK
jgi:hypothetical protein